LFAGQVIRAAFFLGTFSWPRKKKYLARGAKTAYKIKSSQQRYKTKTWIPAYACARSLGAGMTIIQKQKSLRKTQAF